MSATLLPFTDDGTLPPLPHSCDGPMTRGYVLLLFDWWEPEDRIHGMIPPNVPSDYHIDLFDLCRNRPYSTS